MRGVRFRLHDVRRNLSQIVPSPLWTGAVGAGRGGGSMVGAGTRRWEPGLDFGLDFGIVGTGCIGDAEADPVILCQVCPLLGGVMLAMSSQLSGLNGCRSSIAVAALDSTCGASVIPMSSIAVDAFDSTW